MIIIIIELELKEKKNVRTTPTNVRSAPTNVRPTHDATHDANATNDAYAASHAANDDATSTTDGPNHHQDR